MDLAIEDRIAALATRQHGVATRSQLREAGLTERMVERRVARRQLRRLHRGVYLVGPLEPPRARDMAAVLACGPGARVSHATAGWLWKVGPDPGRRRPVQVKVPGRRVVRRPGIRPHRAGPDEAHEVALVDGIPTTTPARTLIDLSRVLPRRELEKAVAGAQRMGLVAGDELAGLVARHRGRPGIATLAGLLAGAGAAAFTRSELEDRFLDDVRRFGLPEPAFNVRVGGYEVDCYWEEAQFAVELDGQAYHSSWQSQANDRRRDGDLGAIGILVVRITWQQLVNEREPTMAKVAQGLAVAMERSRLARRG